jgi:hypothetical protein
MKEVSITSTTTWTMARILFGEKMVRDPASLVVGYFNPFKPRASAKQVPMSLETDDEWAGLIHHVKTFLEGQQAKNRGKGGVSKAWRITLVDLKPDSSSKVCHMPSSLYKILLNACP